jgi:ABC-2 type transport system ATP-binding protein
VYDDTVTSLTGDVEIAITVYRPAGASVENPVPVLLNSHGWAGSRASGASSFAAEQEAGFGVVTVDQRGHGASGGAAAGMDPEKEGQDMIAVVDYVAGLDWVLLEDVDADSPWAQEGRNGDPVLGAWGGSYGGAFQYALAMTEMRDFGDTRVDAMAPDITWNDLNQSFGPNKVSRTVWLSALLGGAYASNTRMESYIPESYAFASATGQYPDGSQPVAFNVYDEFVTHGPAGYRDAENNQIKLDIPMLITQGFSDNLFPFNEAWRSWTDVLTEDARSRSHLVGYNGGHALPNVAPAGYATGGDVCNGTNSDKRRAFFTQALLTTDGNTRVLGPKPYYFSTASGDCLRLSDDDIDYDVTYAPLELDPTGTTGPAIGTVTMAGAPIHLEVATGPLTIAGVPTMTADLYAVGYDQRAFFTLSKGTSLANAQVIQNNVQPLRVEGPTPATGAPLTFKLVGVAEHIAEGETLFLTISPVSDMFANMGSRTPGAIGLGDISLQIPTVR